MLYGWRVGLELPYVRYMKKNENHCNFLTMLDVQCRDIYHEPVTGETNMVLIEPLKNGS